MKFTIGIPAYKTTYLKECIDSVLSQTYSDFELVIVNDASPENIDDIVNNYHSHYIRYYKNKTNFGAANVVNNWNKVFSYAKGDYFILMGDDDKMEPEYLEEFRNLIVRYPELDIYHCRSKIIDENSLPIMLTPSWPEFESVYDNIWHKRFAKRVQFISDFVYRTKALRENGGFYYLPLAWASDDITSYIIMGTKGIAHVNKPMLNYRKHSLTLSTSGCTELKMEALLLQQKWFNNFLLHKPSSDVDLLIYNNICKKIKKSIQKQKVMTMKDSLKVDFIKHCIKWFKSRKKYELSISEIIYSIVLFFQTATIKKKYN